MTLTEATVAIAQCRDRMNAAYRGVVFDEWVVVGTGGRLLFYSGPRSERVRASFKTDAGPLLAELVGRQLQVGEVVFAAEAAGTRYDVIMPVGAELFLLANHTTRTMKDIRANTAWLDAQKPLVQLGERFHTDSVNAR